jgi:hypothetical protein
MMDLWIRLDRGLGTLSKNIDVARHLVNALLERPAPVPALAAGAASDVLLVASIAPLCKTVHELLRAQRSQPLPVLPLSVVKPCISIQEGRRPY